ncbi:MULTISPECIES: inositol monophosphatase family protein [unclassified Psychrobacillus]|uniref:inositol monophosphatase family protein n=1 Tax=unclassified Psychrobacillus TaxID=2636677 RepID=UPI00146F92F4|nr:MULTISPECIES: inositol monophosphatase family protein [unclassified Psychrobacillus]MCM3357088.1 inositol monophosphatase family protein [Psychrobacillus sp. MER TA 171]NME05186.1 inositol monophosphatase family protein [Psychrobacillus sp. BL-248-WT-3]
MDLHMLDKYAKSLIKQAATQIRSSFSEELIIESKSEANDLVTNIDKETEKFFIRHIKKDFPNHRIFGEEGFGDKIENLDGYVWMLDPIDGTTNFIHFKKNFAISLGIYKDGEGILGYIYNVMDDDLLSAASGQGAYLNDVRIPRLESTTVEKSIIGVNASWVVPNRMVHHDGMIELVQTSRGTRSFGSAAIEIAYVATGRLDAYLSMRLSPWDIAGGMVIANEVGAVVTNLSNEPINLLKQNSFIVSKPNLHEQLLSKYIILK